MDFHEHKAILLKNNDEKEVGSLIMVCGGQ